MQHVLAMFVGNTLRRCLSSRVPAAWPAANLPTCMRLLQNAMLVAGIVTLVQLYSIGPIGGKVPIIMGTSSGFIGVFSSVAASMGGGVLTYGAIIRRVPDRQLLQMLEALTLRKLLPSVVTGTVVLSIGLSLISVGVNSFGGGNTAQDFGSVENLLLAIFVLVVILICKHSGSVSRILTDFGGHHLRLHCSVSHGSYSAHHGAERRGVAYTRAWVLNWNKVAEAKWFICRLMPVKPVLICASHRS